MSRPALVLLVLGVGLAAFGWWGQHTVEGHRRFDEMAGIIPWAAFWVGLLVLVIGVVWLAIAGARTGG